MAAKSSRKSCVNWGDLSGIEQMLAISRYVTSCPVLHAWDGMLSNPCIFIGLCVFTVEVPKHDMMAMSLQCHHYFIRVPRGRFKWIWCKIMLKNNNNNNNKNQQQQQQFTSFFFPSTSVSSKRRVYFWNRHVRFSISRDSLGFQLSLILFSE